MGEALAIVSLVLALPPVIERLIRAGQDFSHRLELCKGSAESLQGLALFRDESVKTRTRFALGYKICNSPDPNIHDEIRSHLDQKFQEIQQIIIDTDRLIAKLEKGGFRFFWKADGLRKDIGLRIQILNTAVSAFNDTVNLVHIEQTGPPNAKLGPELFQYSTHIDTAISEASLLVRCHLARNANKVSAKRGTFLLETRPYESFTKQTLENRLAYLSQILIDAEASESMLKAVGYADDPTQQAFLLVFDVPDSLLSAGTLQSLLQSTPQVPALNIRVALCKKLSDAIFDVHNLRLVHKNVNSASVLVMTPRDKVMSSVNDQDIRTYLLDWHLVRKYDVASIPSPERKWWKGIYQHPKRQIMFTEDEYTMGHDVYSLGVCMLEALLWKPLVHFTKGAEPSVNSLFAEQARSLGIVDNTPENLQSFLDHPDDTKDIQRILLRIANQYLPAAAGQKLTTLITSCLSCLEDGFGPLSFRLGTDRIELGMNYVTAVKKLLSGIQL
ncbi:MAG: hypothetical protein Q9190_003293 [Brigantiaea leucoxantha]